MDDARGIDGLRVTLDETGKGTRIVDPVQRVLILEDTRQGGIRAMSPQKL